MVPRFSTAITLGIPGSSGFSRTTLISIAKIISGLILFLAAAAFFFLLYFAPPYMKTTYQTILANDGRGGLRYFIFFVAFAILFFVLLSLIFSAFKGVVRNRLTL